MDIYCDSLETLIARKREALEARKTAGAAPATVTVWRPFLKPTVLGPAPGRMTKQIACDELAAHLADGWQEVEEPDA
jgi:hypothetical protein